MFFGARGRAPLNEPPKLIADLNGRIIYMNSQAMAYLGALKIGDSLSKLMDLDYIRKISMQNNRLDIIVPKNCNYKKAVIRVLGTGTTKTIEVTFISNVIGDPKLYESDKKLFASYADVIGKEMIDTVKLNKFVSKIISEMKKDLRLAYRKFRIKRSNTSPEIYANCAHLSALVVATVIALNEIEYRNTISIGVEEIFDEYVLSISVKSPTFHDVEGIHAFGEVFPNVAMRAFYIASLCDNDGIEYRFSVKPNRITVSFEISELVNSTGKFSHVAFGTGYEELVPYIISLFLYGGTTVLQAKEQE